MTSRVENALTDVQLIYKYFRKIGLILLCLILAGGWIISDITSFRASDRWTGTDQRKYVKEHDKSVDNLVETKMGEINATIKAASNVVIDALDNHINKGAHEDAGQSLARIEQRQIDFHEDVSRRLDRIEKKVFNGGSR